MLVDFGWARSLSVRGSSKNHGDALLIEVALTSTDDVDDRVVIALDRSFALSLRRELEHHVPYPEATNAE